MVDTVVANTNAALTNTDGYSDWEPGIAVDPANPDDIVVTAFSSCWAQECDGHTNAVLWTSTDAGFRWTKSYSVPPPPNRTAGVGCPCDQTAAYGRNSRFYATFLNDLPNPPGEIYTGSSTDAAKAADLAWQNTAGTATHTNAAGTDGDQPQLVTGPDPSAPARDLVYVGYDDFNASPPAVRVAVDSTPLGSQPVRDHQIGTSSECCINPGLRLATDHRSGAIYAVWEVATFNSAASPQILVHYRLNRSTDGGKTWSLNGSSTGIQLAAVPSDQMYNSFTGNPMKFGTVNALFGGIDSVAVDPTTGDVYVVYGRRDTSTSKNRLEVIRLRKNASGGLTPGAPVYASGQCQCALPSIAVANSGEIGLLYDAFNGFDASGFPQFSAHLTRSRDHGATFSDVVLSTWSSVVKADSDSRQRVLGDYQQLKANGMAFYGTFTANGIGFGRPFANTDAIFFKASADPAITSVAPSALARGAADEVVTINGAGFASGAHVTFSNPGIHVLFMPSIAGNTITVEVTVSPSASLGPSDVTVTNANKGQATCSQCLAVKP